MSDYLHEALSCAFGEADCWDAWHGIGHDKQMEIAKSIQVSVEMEHEVSSYSHPSAGDMFANREREITARFHREIDDREMSHNREVEGLRDTIRRLENRIYELRANAD